jgi:hypothetical protein
MATSNNIKIDHDFILKTILDNDGYIHGGYVRAWILNENPSDNGWNDIDCVFESPDNRKNVQRILFDQYGFKCPKIDTRQLGFGFNDFFCNCWKFDGRLRLVEPANGSFSFEQLKEETQEKIAKCITSIRWVSRIPNRIKRFTEDGWTVLKSDGTPVSPSFLIS